ncbi:hypothetical protein R9X47_18185 [Wukongibacter baidiensis]|uniref:hypothetical protein n=1 Tax=Wukongibacter baidiensis TaxID=1723361 RepID=UPI003D7F3D81
MADCTTNYNLKKPIKTEKYSVDDQNGNMDILDTEIKKLDAQMADLATKQSAALENNISVFDNTGNIKDSGKALGNTSGKILELPTGLAQGDILRVGSSGQIERLPKGNDGQVLGYQSGLLSPVDLTGGGMMEEVARITDTYSSTITFSNIPSKYIRLKVVGIVRVVNLPASPGYVNARINGVSTNNYLTKTIESDVLNSNTVLTGVNQSLSFFELCSPITNAGYSFFEADFMTRDNYDVDYMGRGMGLGTQRRLTLGFGTAGNVGKIDSISLTNNNYFETDSIFILYGGE